MLNNDSCYCGSGQAFQQCCEALHRGKQKAETAEQLMRSRFSAFCVSNADYLISTHHPSKRSSDDKQSLASSFEQTHFTQLTILNCRKGSNKDNDGWVEFIASFLENEKLGQLHEVSRFIKEDGTWYYLDGEIKTSDQIKANRNAPCPCGSGKKFKKCCGP